ncbi:MAG: type IV pilus assembly protein PilM [Planctomycetes bacterium]|nr:type IV pilus assembly protein PilM [Planctomycetota bacterium]
MASVWGIDIGKAALKAVKLASTKDGYEIQALDYFPYPVEEDEDERQEHVSDAVRKFLTKHKLRGEEIVVSIPGLHSFSRFISLPPVEKAKLRMMVRLEAQQQIPFPIDEVNWDFLEIDREYEEHEEVEIGIFATRTELIDGFLGDLKESGLYPDTITIAPLAAYNFIRENLPDKEGGTILLDIGAEHTDLVIFDGERFWVRNLRIAGNEITKALADRFKIPFAEAEKLKKSSSKSAQAKKIFASMEPVLKDLVGEIHRSVGFFKSQAEDLDVKRMILMGDGSKLRNLPAFLKKQLKYEVKRAPELSEQFVFDDDVDPTTISEHHLAFGVAFGLALQGQGASRCAINLAPKQQQIQAVLKKKVPFALITAIVAWAAFGMSYAYWDGVRKKYYSSEKALKKIQSWKNSEEAAMASNKLLPPLEKDVRIYDDLGEGRTLVPELMEKIRGVLVKATAKNPNSKLPKLSSTVRSKPVREQLTEWRKKIRTLNEKKLWLLDWKVRRLERKGTQTPYDVEIRLGMATGGRSGADIRSDIEGSVVRLIKEALNEAPFHVRNPAEAMPKGYGGVDLSVAEELFQLHPDARSEPQKPFEVTMIKLRFEVGVAAPPKAKKVEPAEGEEEGG